MTAYTAIATLLGFILGGAFTLIILSPHWRKLHLDWKTTNQQLKQAEEEIQHLKKNPSVDPLFQYNPRIIPRPLPPYQKAAATDTGNIAYRFDDFEKET